MSKVVNHVHKLRRHTFKTGNRVYFCTLPDCHFKIDVELSLGKRNLCNRCSQEFLMNEYSIRLAKPHCPNCQVPSKKRRFKSKPVEIISGAIADDSINELKSKLNSILKESTYEPAISSTTSESTSQISNDDEDGFL